MKNCSRIKVEVLQRHIDAGEPGDPNACPIALAVRETLDAHKFPSFIAVNTDGIVVDSCGVEIDGNAAGVSAPERIAKFVEKFDRAGEEENGTRRQRMNPKPFTFYLE